MSKLKKYINLQMKRFTMPGLLLAVVCLNLSGFSPSGEDTPPKDDHKTDKGNFLMEIDRLVENLNSERFQTRSEASKALEKMGVDAEPMLRKILAKESSPEVRRRIQQILATIGDLFEADSPGWKPVYQGVAQGQRFRSKGGKLDKHYLRVARLNQIPKADLQVEIRDVWLDQIYAQGIIPAEDAREELAWREVSLRHRASMSPGKDYILLFHSRGSSNESPWAVNDSSVDLYPYGRAFGDEKDNFFFRLVFAEKQFIHVGPPVDAGGKILFINKLAKKREPEPELGPFRLGGNGLPPGEIRHDADVTAHAQKPIRCEEYEEESIRLAFSRDGKTLVSGAGDHTLRLWNVADGKLIRRIDLVDRIEQPGAVPCIHAMRDNKTIAILQDNQKPMGTIGSYRRRIRFWNRNTGEEVTKLFPVVETTLSTFAFSRDETLIALAEGDKKIVVRDWATRKIKSVLALPQKEFDEHSLKGLAFSPDGKSLAVSFRVNGDPGDELLPVVTVWDLASGKEILSTMHHDAWVGFFDDGRLVCANCISFQVWDLIARKHLWTRSIPATAYCFAVGEKVDRLAAGGDMSAIIWFHAATRKSLGRLEGQEAIGDIAFSPDGTKLASAGHNNQILIWNVKQP